MVPTAGIKGTDSNAARVARRVCGSRVGMSSFPHSLGNGTVILVAPAGICSENPALDSPASLEKVPICTRVVAAFLPDKTI